VGTKIENPHNTTLAKGHPLNPDFEKTRKGDFKKMKDENKRTLYLKVRVSPEEMDAIKRKFQNSEMDTLSGFVRAMIFEGYIVQMDKNEIHAIYKLVANIANSINQIALRVNRTGNIYAKDIEDIQSKLNMIWQQLHFLNAKILQLRH